MSADAAVRVLNLGNYDNEPSISALRLSSELQKLMLRMKGSFISEDGRNVNYKVLKGSEMFQRYLTEARKLQAADMKELSREERMAFCINIYNALTIHALVMCDEGIPNSVLEVGNFWRVHAYNIGGLVFSLDDLEHGILRGNRAHPADGKSLFLHDDPRMALTIKDFDPRIHFALVCGAKSCPAIRVYSPENLDAGLQSATESFCSQEVCIAADQVTLSKIFHWYRADFGKDDSELLKWISTNLSPDKRQQLESILRLLEDGQSAQIKFRDYNWNLNYSNL